MQSNTSRLVLRSFLKAITCAALLLGSFTLTQAEDKKADANGTWSWTTPGRNGGPDRKSTLKLKVEGETVTGAISSPGRGGDGSVTETKIENGKIKGDEVSFSVTRTFNDNKMVQKFHGKVGADSITGKIEFERNGESQSRDWTAKREADKK